MIDKENAKPGINTNYIIMGTMLLIGACCTIVPSQINPAFVTEVVAMNASMPVAPFLRIFAVNKRSSRGRNALSVACFLLLWAHFLFFFIF